MRKPEAVVTAILNRWAAGEMSEEQLSKHLQGCGWTRRDVRAYLERADAMAQERRAFEERSRPPERLEQAGQPPQARDFHADRRAALESRPAAAEALGRWRREELNLLELLDQLQAAGWMRREVYAYLERETDQRQQASRDLQN